jgi:hypothetical protein
MSSTKIHWSDEVYKQLATHLVATGVRPTDRNVGSSLVRAQVELLPEHARRPNTSVISAPTLNRIRQIMRDIRAGQGGQNKPAVQPSASPDPATSVTPEQGDETATIIKKRLRSSDAQGNEVVRRKTAVKLPAVVPVGKAPESMSNNEVSTKPLAPVPAEGLPDALQNLDLTELNVAIANLGETIGIKISDHIVKGLSRHLAAHVNDAIRGIEGSLKIPPLRIPQGNQGQRNDGRQGYRSGGQPQRQTFKARNETVSAGDVKVYFDLPPSKPE